MVLPGRAPVTVTLACPVALIVGVLTRTFRIRHWLAVELAVAVGVADELGVTVAVGVAEALAEADGDAQEGDAVAVAVADALLLALGDGEIWPMIDCTGFGAEAEGDGLDVPVGEAVDDAQASGV